MKNYKFNPIINVLIAFFIIFLGNNHKGISQFSPSDILAKDAIVNLKKGTLIIGIPSFKRQLDELHKLQESDEVSSKRQDLILKRIKKYEDQQDRYKEYIMKGFNESYFFSDFVFCNDYELRKADTTQTVLLIDSTLINLDESHFIAIEGREPQEHHRIEALVIKDHEFKLLGNPFPDFILSERPGFSLRFLFNNELREKARLERYGWISNFRFQKFYDNRENLKWTLWKFISSIF